MSYLVGSEENTTLLRDRHRTGDTADTATCLRPGDRRPAMSGARVGGPGEQTPSLQGNFTFIRVDTFYTTV